MADAAAPSPRRPFGPWRLYQLFAQLHEHDRVVRFAETWPGRLLLFGVAAVLLVPFGHTELVLPAAALAMILPGRRRLVLSSTGVLVLLDLMTRRAQGTPAGADRTALELWQPIVVAAAAFLVFSALVFFAARNFARLPAWVRRHPVISLHATFWVALVCVWGIRPPHLSATMLVFSFLPFFLWRASYLVLSAQRGKVEGTRFSDHFFVFWPAFGGTGVPYGKGLDHLARHEAQDRPALARSQLAGVKLLFLAVLWEVASRSMGGFVYSDRESALVRMLGGFSFDVPHVQELLRGERTTSIPVAWLAVYLELVRVTLWLAVIGHVIVGSLRLMGFNVFRNTYKPLLAESIVDFWGRYYYYFKELLVELWFYPTYLAVSRKHARLRLFAATFAAAFLGNVYYHVVRDRGLLAMADFSQLWALDAPGRVYCLLLALGVLVSMSRQQASRGAVPPEAPRLVLLGRVRRIFGVWTFFALIHLWSITVPGVGSGDRLHFLLELVGIDAR